MQALREPLAEIVRGHELLRELTLRELRVRYKQTLLGAAWALFTPALMMVVFSTIFARLRGQGNDLDTFGAPYAIFVYCGLLPWQWFAGAMKNCAESLTRNSRLVSKIYMPREVFPLSSVLSGLADFAVASTLLGVLMLWHRFPLPLAGLAWLPLVVGVQFLLVSGLGLLLAMANLFYRDVKYVLEVVLLVGMFATSVVYPIKAADLGGWTRLLALNPMTHIIDAYRQTLLAGQPPHAPGFAYAAALSAVVFLWGLKKFHECEFLFAERV